jgi:hypothetical protein
MSAKTKSPKQSKAGINVSDLLPADYSPDFMEDLALQAHEMAYEHYKKTKNVAAVWDLIDASYSLVTGVIFIMENDGKATKAMNQTVGEDIAIAIRGIVALGGKIRLQHE